MQQDPLLAEIDDDDDDDSLMPEDEYGGGDLITLDHFMDGILGERHPLDTLSRDARATVWQLSQGMHDYMRAETGGPLPRHHHRLWGGPKGKGKSQCANHDAYVFFLLGGMVYSWSALGYGMEISKDEFYTLAESVGQNMWIYLDEVHVLVDSHPMAARNQIVAENDALLRKRSARLDATSTREHRLPPFYREEVDVVFYPNRWVPAAQKAAYKRGERPQWNFPSWCYVRVDAIGPRPYVPRGLREEWGVAPKSEKTRRMTKVMDPQMLYLASHMYDSFAAPPLGAGMNTSADDIRSATAEAKERQAAIEDETRQKVLSFREGLAEALRDGMDIDVGRGGLDHVFVHSQVMLRGCTMSEEEMMRYLRTKGVVKQSRRIDVDKLLAGCVSPNLWNEIEAERAQLYEGA